MTGAGMHPGWTAERLLRLAQLADGDAAYLSSLRRPWRVPVQAVLSDADIVAAAEDLARWRDRFASYRVPAAVR